MRKLNSSLLQRVFMRTAHVDADLSGDIVFEVVAPRWMPYSVLAAAFRSYADGFDRRARRDSVGDEQIDIEAVACATGVLS